MKNKKKLKKLLGRIVMETLENTLEKKVSEGIIRSGLVEGYINDALVKYISLSDKGMVVISQEDAVLLEEFKKTIK
ncbi:MAG: hypothetical protein IE916_00405 [Epsilonproteobacteria bacterium]|nr:hypothetical protein [Campylobacterota bacterium]